jgi:DNA-directed RNA polymerase specialized sigma subunit
MRKKLDETDILVGNADFISEMSEKYGRGLDGDDRYCIGLEAMLYAMRLYDKQYWEFHHFAEEVISQLMAAERRARYTRMRFESPLSLDKSVMSDGHSETVGSIFFHSGVSFVVSIEFNDFLYHLQKDVKKMAEMYIAGFTDEEIQFELGISDQDLGCFHKKIISAWEFYNGDV